MTAETRRSAWRLGIASAVLMWSCAFAFTAAEPAAAPIPQAPIRQDQLDFFESREVPFVVAVNEFDGVHHHGIDEVRAALSIAVRLGAQRSTRRAALR